MFSRIFSKLSRASGKHDPAVSTDTPQNSTGTDVAASAPGGGGKRRRRGGKGGGKSQSPQATASAAAGKAPAVSQVPWDPAQFAVEPQEGKTRFQDLGLPDTLLHAIADLGFTYCSPIQARALPYTLQGGDVVGKAQTGTGKTAAFLITVITDLLKNPVQHERYAGEARAVVLAPTRELAIQIGEDAKNLCKYCGLTVHTLVGGMDYQKQKNHLHSELVDILVATPGRLIDFMESRDVFLDEVDCLVIDEADRMLDMGFIPQVKRIVRATPPKENRQTLLFSATFNHDVLNLASQWTCSPVHIEIQPERVATDTVQQHVYMVSSDEKFMVLMNLLQRDDAQSVIVFANRRDICRDLFEQLRACGVPCGLLSGDIDQNKRVKTLEQFRGGQTRVLVATDVAGRGIHIDGISHVVNYTLPEVPDDYVHRIGRTGRAGASGVSVSFACEDDGFMLPGIERLLGRKLPCEVPPDDLVLPLPEELSLRAEKALRESRRERRAQFNERGGSGGRSGGGRSSGGRSGGSRSGARPRR